MPHTLLRPVLTPGRMLVPPVTSASVVVCTWSAERLSGLLACLASLRLQHLPPDEVIVVVDDDQLLPRVSTALADGHGPTVLANRHGRGLAGARHTGLESARSDVVAFLDDGSTPDGDWLDELLRPFVTPHVVSVTGRDSSVAFRRRPLLDAGGFATGHGLSPSCAALGRHHAALVA